MNFNEAAAQGSLYVSLISDAASRYAAELMSGLSVLCLLLIVWLILGRRASSRSRQALLRANQLLQGVRPTQGLESNLAYLLEIVASIVGAPTYALYVYDDKNKNYVLRAVRHKSVDFGKVRPSYSGLVPYQKETYHPPVSLPPAAAPVRVSLATEGEVPLLTMPLQGHGMVRIGPLSGARRQALKALDELSAKLGPLLQTVVETDKLKTQAEITLHSAAALKHISDVATGRQATMELMLQASYRSMEAAGGLIVERRGAGLRIAAHAGVPQEQEAELLAEAGELAPLLAAAAGREQALLPLSGLAAERLPAFFRRAAPELFALVELDPGDGAEGLIVYWFAGRHQEASLHSHGLSSLRTIAQEVGAVLQSQLPVQQLSRAYTQLLKNMAVMMDNLNPYTVGYSELMSRYAILIARELQLPEADIRDIALAAHLSNIGVLGLSRELYQKEGRYTEKEFELMKLHAEVGSTIIGVTTGNQRVAAYILHHHERIDGNGYPAGLKGDEIPLGARIIAVVQTFLAKINGRASRDPLRFDQALQTLQAAAGTQLDSQVVEALLGWFRSKQSNPALAGRSLGSCWEMCCTPSSVCEHCPAYRRTDINCWQVEGNNCKAHGKSCDTCFVLTEYQWRSSAKK